MEHPFDRLARRLGEERSRRAVLQQASVAFVGAVAAALLPHTVHGAPPCDQGQVACSGACTDILSDPANCGGCGVSAGAGGTCNNGVVTPGPQQAPPAASPPAQSQ